MHASLNYYVFMEFAGDVSLHKVLHARCEPAREGDLYVSDNCEQFVQLFEQGSTVQHLLNKIESIKIDSFDNFGHHPWWYFQVKIFFGGQLNNHHPWWLFIFWGDIMLAVDPTFH